jgi:WD40 repeat protein/serine/threonine protein kinase
LPALPPGASANQITTVLPPGAAPDAQSAERIGGEKPNVPGYDILDELGRGGMGVVYKARQKSLNRIVALKMILTGAHAGPQDLARFRSEAEAVAQFQHPHIVQVYEIGEQDGRPFFSLEFVDGGSLAQRLTGVPLPARQAAGLVEILARAVGCAHQHGIVHRDLKPANVLLTADGTPKITDFGLAKRLDSQVGQTKTGAIMGTPSYMAPEQARGKTREIGPTADIYALGSILYEMLTGRPPFRGETPLETILQVTSNEPVPPTRLHSKVPRDLETICLKCLQKEPRKRYPSGDELANDARRFLDNEPILARPISRWERVLRWARRRPAAAALIGVSLLATLLLVAALTISNVLIHAKQLETDGALHALQEAHEKLADQQRQTEAAFEREKNALAERTRALDKEKQSAYFHRIDLAAREWLANNVGRAEELLELCPPELRRWEWYYLKRLCRADLLSLHVPSDAATAVAISPDGGRLAVVGSRSVQPGGAREEIKVWNAVTGQELCAITSHRGATTAAFSHDGQLLASAGRDREDPVVRVWDAATGKPRHTLSGHNGAVLALAFSPDGKHLASAGWDATVRVWDLATGNETHSFKDHTREVLAVAFSPDGRQVASAGEDRTVRVWDRTTGKALLLPGHQDAVLAVAFSPDGTRLASASWDKSVKVWDLASGQEVLTTRGFLPAFKCLAFSPDGQRLAAAGEEKAVKVWDAATGQELFIFRGHDATVTGVAFSRDGRRLASVSEDGTVKVWDATASQELRSLAGHTGDVHSVAFRPDGRLLASASRDKTVKLRDARTGEEVHVLRGHSDEVTGLAFSRDGKCLASASLDHTVRIWDVAGGRELFVLSGHGCRVYGVSFSPNGKRVASASEGGMVKVWDATTGQEIHTFREHRRTVGCVAFSQDGQSIASAGEDNAIKVWDAATGLVTAVLTGHADRVWSLAFSPDGRSLASASHDRTVKVWDLATGEEALTLKGHSGEVNGVAFSADGRRLASASDDRTVKLWEVLTGQEVLTLRGHAAEVTSVAFSPDDQLLAAAGRDGTVKVWEAPRATARP